MKAQACSVFACQAALDNKGDDDGNEREPHRGGRDILCRPGAGTRLGQGYRGAVELRTAGQLLNAVDAALKPKVFCVQELADQGAGHPDFGLFAAKQVQRGQACEGQTPERGLVEVKAAKDEAWLTAAGGQVSRYWDRYRLVLVTNCPISCWWERIPRCVSP